MGKANICALDIATHCGVAYGEIGTVPKTMTWKAPAADADDYGSRFLAFYLWLMPFCEMGRFTILAFEAPLVTGPVGGTPKVRLLIGLASMAEFVGTKLGIEVVEKHVGSIRKAFCGSGRAQKDEVQRGCRLRGYSFANADEADALAVWDVVAGEVSQGAAIRSTPLFLGAGA